MSIASVLFLIILIGFAFLFMSNRIKKSANTLGIYENLIEFSQEGGMATVFKAKNSKTGNVCILKVLRQEMANDRDIVEKFFREPEIIEIIKKNDDQARVPEVYSYGKLKDRLAKLPFIEMEFIPGNISLRDYLKHYGKLTLHEADLVISRLLPTIRTAHQHNIIHRDLKPENILLKNGQLSDPIIIDYGIAKIQGTSRTKAIAYMSPEYMAPEQSNSVNEDHTIKLDIYQLGSIYYEMLTGQRIFYDQNPMNIIHSHINDSPDEKINKNMQITSLSGGQSRALMIADIACISNSSIVLMDAA